MSNEKPVESNSTPPDESTKPKKPATVELSEEEMGKVTGGVSIAYEQIQYQYYTQD